MSILCLDMSIKETGYAIFDYDDAMFELIDYGSIFPTKYKGFSTDTTLVRNARFIDDVCSQIQDIYCSDLKINKVVIEEINMGGVGGLKANKSLAMLHGVIMWFMDDDVDKVEFTPSSKWRSKLGIKLTKEDRTYNKKLKDKKLKIGYKDLSLRYVNDKYPKICNNNHNVADAICLGEAWIKENV